MTILNDGFEPRPDASQRAAAQHRETEPPPHVAQRQSAPPLVLTAALAVLIVALLIVASYQLSGGRPKALQVTPQPTIGQPTEAPYNALSASQTRATPVPTPIPALAPTAAPTAFSAPPQTGRGLGVVEQQSVVDARPPTYIEVVAEQAPHCIRDCDGQPGVAGGEWVAVPTLAPEQLRVVADQAPHKVR